MTHFTGFDVDSEIKLYEALSDIALGRTIIIVSNRVWHLRLCNKIFVLEEGKIKQQGSFDELRQIQDILVKRIINKFQFWS